ncbi:hypothetical protein AADZ90_011235 [Aestuariibius sp. 2305UL40-4]|uniref:hypothetical protein n=1 Tax=Aestuariibius violaceus TaxID=3234132 RepID=UPI00345E31FE
MAEPAYVTLTLPLKIGPIERGDFWEDPLSEKLEEQGIGAVTGGGTMMSQDGGIEFVDLEVELEAIDDGKLDALVAAMVAIGAPKGTKIVNDDGETLRTLGSISVVGIGLDGTGLPDSAYEGFDADAFSDEIVAQLGEGYSYGGSHAGARYTFFYYHGADAERIKEGLGKIAAEKPIGQGAKIEQIA